MLIGLIFVAIECIFHSWANVLDSVLTNKIFRNVSALIFFSQLINVLFLPIILALDFPKLITLPLFGVVFVISLIEILYQYPYYWSLRSTDTSIVTSLFSLGKIFVPLLSFLLVKEQLAIAQYVGFFVIVFSSAVLTLDMKKLRVNRALLFMLVVSILLSIQAVFFKWLFEQGVSWGSAMAWTLLTELLLSLLAVLLPSNLAALSKLTTNGQFKLSILAQALTWGGEAAGAYALYLIPVSVVKGVDSTQPIFVFLYAIWFSKKLPEYFRERLAGGKLKRILLFVLIVTGTLLVVLR